MVYITQHLSKMDVLIQHVAYMLCSSVLLDLIIILLGVFYVLLTPSLNQLLRELHVQEV